MSSWTVYRTIKDRARYGGSRQDLLGGCAWAWRWWREPVYTSPNIIFTGAISIFGYSDQEQLSLYGYAERFYDIIFSLFLLAQYEIQGRGL